MGNGVRCFEMLPVAIVILPSSNSTGVDRDRGPDLGARRSKSEAHDLTHARTTIRAHSVQWHSSTFPRVSLVYRYRNFPIATAAHGNPPTCRVDGNRRRPRRKSCI